MKEMKGMTFDDAYAFEDDCSPALLQAIRAAKDADAEAHAAEQAAWESTEVARSARMACAPEAARLAEENAINCYMAQKLCKKARIALRKARGLFKRRCA